MIELKNASLRLGDRQLFDRLSFCLGDGSVMRVGGRQGTGKTTLLRVILGYQPLDSGLVSLEEELLTPASAVAFRGMTAYVPTRFRPPVKTVEQLVRLPFQLKCNSSVNFSRERVIEEWARAGLPATLYDQTTDALTPQQTYLLLVANAALLGKRIILVDTPPQPLASPIVEWMKEVAQQTNASVVVCEENDEDRLILG